MIMIWKGLFILTEVLFEDVKTYSYAGPDPGLWRGVRLSKAFLQR